RPIYKPRLWLLRSKMLPHHKKLRKLGNLYQQSTIVLSRSLGSDSLINFHPTRSMIARSTWSRELSHRKDVCISKVRTNVKHCASTLMKWKGLERYDEAVPPVLRLSCLSRKLMVACDLSWTIGLSIKSR